MNISNLFLAIGLSSSVAAVGVASISRYQDFGTSYDDRSTLYLDQHYGNYYLDPSPLLLDSTTVNDFWVGYVAFQLLDSDEIDENSNNVSFTYLFSDSWMEGADYYNDGDDIWFNSLYAWPRLYDTLTSSNATSTGAYFDLAFLFSAQSISYNGSIYFCNNFSSIVLSSPKMASYLCDLHGFNTPFVNQPYCFNMSNISNSIGFSYWTNPNCLLNNTYTRSGFGSNINVLLDYSGFYSFNSNNIPLNSFVNMYDNAYFKLGYYGCFPLIFTVDTLGFNTDSLWIKTEFIVNPLNVGINSSIAYDLGYKNGYQVGYADGSAVEFHNTDFLSLMAAIADVPVMVITNLFNFDLFGISALTVVLSLIVGVIVIFIIKKVVK